MYMYTPDGVKVFVLREQVELLKEAGWTVKPKGEKVEKVEKAPEPAPVQDNPVEDTPVEEKKIIRKKKE